ncbi:MAG: hypothetical protein QM529_04340 [Hydrotalea sp.]|nr:hypothetical protein [Hydrotalea sp.]
MQKKILSIGKFIGAVAVVLSLTACASRENFDSTMLSLVGKNRAEVFALLGAPSTDYNLSGYNYLVYQQAELGVAGAPPMITGQSSGGAFHEGAEGQTYYKKWCQTTFMLQNGIVKSYQAKGNNCRR